MCSSDNALSVTHNAAVQLDQAEASAELLDQVDNAGVQSAGGAKRLSQRGGSGTVESAARR